MVRKKFPTGVKKCILDIVTGIVMEMDKMSWHGRFVAALDKTWPGGQNLRHQSNLVGKEISSQKKEDKICEALSGPYIWFQTTTS